MIGKKEKLLKNKDVSKWGYQGEGGVGEIERNYERLMGLKEAAFTYMLQNETKELELQREHLSFYTN